MPSSSASWKNRLPRLAAVLLGAALSLIIAEVLRDKHGHFAAEDRFGFYGLCGLITPLLVLLAAIGLRPFLERKVDYYND